MNELVHVDELVLRDAVGRAMVSYPSLALNVLFQWGQWGGVEESALIELLDWNALVVNVDG